MFADAGYNGERLVLLHTTDQPFYNLATLVVADSLTRVGVNVEDQAMDWGTTLQRRSSEEPLNKGGWSLFVSVTPVPEYRDPRLWDRCCESNRQVRPPGSAGRTIPRWKPPIRNGSTPKRRPS